MNVEQLLNTDMIMFDCIAGSHAYDTNIATSDVDKRGIYLHPDSAYLSLDQPLNQISDKSNDTTYYSLRRFFELTAKATPNTLELLWMPEDSIVYQSDAFKHLVKNRDLFISKKCYHTFTGYAFAQISKSRGRNKLINSPITNGYYKLKKLYSEGKISKDWIESRFGSKVSSCF